MFFDIGGWWLSCDHMFRRFGTPFAVDWLAKNVNGYVYTTAIPADPGAAHRRDRVQRPLRRPRAARRRLRGDDGRVPRHGPAGLRRALRRLVARPARPEMERNFAFLEARLDARDEMDLAESRCLLEDAIDIHDRHWKIHWMLNFAQLSATLNLRAVMEKTRGAVDEQLLGRLQNSASDRNWDSIEALWRMKNEVRDDAELRAAFAPEDAAEIVGAPCRRASAAGGSSPSGSSRTSASSAGTPSGATSSSSRPSASRWSRSSSSIRGYLDDRLRLPERDRGDAPRHRGRLARDPRRA